MSLFERIREKRINLTEQSFTDRQKSDMKKLLNKNFGSKEISKKTADTQKQLAKDNKKMYDVTGKSAVRDAKKYASGEYPKIGGGTRIGSKSKGGGATTGGTKTVKQSEVSKQAKKYTKKINVKKITKDANRLVRRAEKGDKGARKEVLSAVDRKFKKMSPSDQNKMADDMINIQKKMGRKFNPKTGNFEGPDTKFQKSISKIKTSKGKRITSGPVSVTAGPKIRKRVEKIRDTRATKAGMPDPFKVDQPKFSQKDFETSLKRKFPKKPKTASQPIVSGGGPPPSNLPTIPTSSFKKPPDPFKTSTTKTGSLLKGFKFQPRDVSAKKYEKKVDTDLKKAQKSFRQLSRDIQDYRDRDVPGGPKKTRGTKMRVSYRTTPGGRESVGMATKFVNKYKKGHPLNPEISGIDFDKPKSNLKTVSSVTGGGGGTKPPVNRKTGGTGGNKPRKPRKITKKLVSPGVAKVSAAPKATRKITKILGGSSNVDFYKSGSKLARGISKVSPGAGKLALGATKTLAKLGTPGRIAATVGTVAALSPAARKGISSFAKQALAGAGLGGVIGGAAASQKKSDEERIKKAMKPVFKKGKDGKEIKKVATVGLNLSDVNKPKKKDKGRTPQSIATEVDYLKKRQKVAPYGAKYTG